MIRNKYLFLTLAIHSFLCGHVESSNDSNSLTELDAEAIEACQSNTRINWLTSYPLEEPDQREQNINEEVSEVPFKEAKTAPKWILKSSIRNAPPLLKGILCYLKMRCPFRSIFTMTENIPSFHRFILVGPPGSGKTTMAHAIGYFLGYPTISIGASALLGHYRNETARNIQGFLMQHASDGLPKVIIIDELHKLFELHGNEHSDDSQNAAAFWLAIDEIEKHLPNVILIATANNVDKLPKEIKSRFSGKVITMPLPNKKQKHNAFRETIMREDLIILDESFDDKSISKIIERIDNCSLRDIQYIIDAAKIFYYAENITDSYDYDNDLLLSKSIPVLKYSHFCSALDPKFNFEVHKRNS